MIKFVRTIKYITLFVALFLICTIEVFANGPGDTININKIAVVGDSYAGHFNIDEGTKEFDYFIFPVGTVYNPLNLKVFDEAINSNDKYILFSTGVNDQALNTDLLTFETVLRSHIAKITALNKYLCFHTYMNYPRQKDGQGTLNPEDYDKVLRNLANESPNVFYIDMSGLNIKRYDFGDGLHYNSFYNDTLKAKLIFYTSSIEDAVNNVYKSGINSIDKRQVAVAGDDIAYNFYGHENKKNYVMSDYSCPALTIGQSKDSIMKAINSDAKNIFISLGEADYLSQTDIYEFKDMLRECLNAACLKQKNVFLTSSLDYSKNDNLPYNMSLYDFEIEHVADEYPNACFLNMRSYLKNQISFYDDLYTLLSAMIDKTL